TPMLFRLLTPLLAAAILMSPLAGVGWAQASFQAIELEAPERIRTVLTGDFDGDGDGDIAAAYVEGLPPAQTRLLTVFWQTAPGTWERTHASTSVLPAEVAVMDVGRIDGRDRIAMLRYDGVDVVDFDGKTISGTTRLIETDSIVFHGELGDVTTFDFLQDLFGEGRTSIVVPKWGRLEI